MTVTTPARTVQTLIEALPYIRRFWGATMVAQVRRRRHDLAAPAGAVRRRHRAAQPGGHEARRGARRRPEVTRHMARLGMEPRFVDGQRVTDEATLEVARWCWSARSTRTSSGLINAARRHGRGHLRRGRPALRVAAQGARGRRGQPRRPRLRGRRWRASTRRVLDLLAEANIPVVASVGADDAARPTTSTPTPWPARSPRRWAPRRSSS